MNTRWVRRSLGILILLVSLALLVWGMWPVGYESLSVPVAPENLQLPTPTTWLAIWIML